MPAPSDRKARSRHRRGTGASVAATAGDCGSGATPSGCWPNWRGVTANTLRARIAITMTIVAPIHQAACVKP